MKYGWNERVKSFPLFFLASFYQLLSFYFYSLSLSYLISSLLSYILRILFRDFLFIVFRANRRKSCVNFSHSVALFCLNFIIEKISLIFVATRQFFVIW